MSYPVLPLFLRGVLKTPVEIIGLVEGISESIVSFMKGWAGFRSDRVGKRTPFIKWGYGLSTVGKTLVGFAYAWPTVLVARSLDRVGKGIRTTARDAMIADAVEPSDYGKAFGFHRAMDTAGAFVGVAIALLLLTLLPGQYRTIFLIAAIPGAVSVMVALRLKEIPAAVTEGPDERPTFRDTIGSLTPAYWKALMITSLFGLANTSDAFLLIRAKDVGLSDVQVILAYMAYNLVVVLLSTWAGKWSDRVGRWKAIGLGWGLYAITYAAFPSATGPFIWMAFALYGVYYAFSQGTSKALVADHSPARVRAGAMGLFYMVSGVATIVGNAVMGVIWQMASPAMAFYIAAALAAIAALSIPLVRRPADA